MSMTLCKPTCLLAVLALALFGCPSFSTMGTARTIGRGKTQLLVAAEGMGSATHSGVGVLPQLELAGRYGFTDDVELGLKAWYLGAALDAKVQLIRSANPESGLDVAFDPTIGWGAPNKLTVAVPLLLGFNFRGGHQLVLGPRLVDQLWFDPAQPAARAVNALLAGMSVGFAWKISERVRLMPELSVLYPIAAAPGVSTYAGTGVAYQGGFGILIFGG